MTAEVWKIIAICIILAYGYVFIMDRKNKTKFSWKKYAAISVCLVIGIIATAISKLQKYVGSPMIGLLIGMLAINLMPSINKNFKDGAAFAAKRYLSFGIILAGATLSFIDVMAATKALPLVIFNICISFSVAYLVGKKVLKLTSNTCTLVGGGTSICGGTAIAALASIIRAKEEEIAYAITAIFLFDVFACITYPYIAGFLGLTDAQFGIFAGTAINDTSSVAAAQETYALLNNITDFSLPITVKLVRTTMLIVLAVIFAVIVIKKETANASSDTSGSRTSVFATVKKVFPWFILIFLVMAILNTVGIFNSIPHISAFFKNGYKFFVSVALAGVGFKIRFKDLFTKGIKPILLGGFTWLAIAASTIIFIYLFKNYINNIF